METNEPNDGHAGNPFTQVPIEITISVGRARPLVRELLRLKRDACCLSTGAWTTLWNFMSGTS